MKFKPVLYYSLLFLLVTGVFIKSQPVQAQESKPDLLIKYVNAYRSSKGLGELTANPQLMAAAQAQADYLAKTYNVEKGGDGTVGERGTLPQDRAYQYGYAAWETYEVVENWIVLNMNYPLENVVTNDWWKTSYNQKNLLDGWGTTYLDIGVGIAEAFPLVYYVVDIGAKLDVAEKVVITSTYGDVFSFTPIETVAPGEDGSIIHKVRQGESLEIIALSYGVSKTVIMDYNGITSSSMMLYPDQDIVIQKPYGDTSSGQAVITATNLPSSTATTAPTYTPRPHATITPSPTSLPPTHTPTATPEPSALSEVSIGMVGLIAVGLGILGLLIFFIVYSRRHH